MKKDLLIALLNKCVQTGFYCTVNDAMYKSIKNVIVDKDKQLIGDDDFPPVIEKRALF